MIYAGQVYKQKRKRRSTRFVRVEFLCRGGQRVRIKRVNKVGMVIKGGRSTEVDADLFGKPGGFSLTNIM